MKNQPPTDGKVLDYKEVSQVKNGSTVTITPVGFDVTRLVRQWYNTGKNYGIMLKRGYENDTRIWSTVHVRDSTLQTIRNLHPLSVPERCVLLPQCRRSGNLPELS